MIEKDILRVDINETDSPEVVAQKTHKALEQYLNPLEGEFEEIKSWEKKIGLTRKPD